MRSSDNAGSASEHLLTTVDGYGRVPHVRTTCPGEPWGVHGPKMVFSNAFCSLQEDADLGKRTPLPVPLKIIREATTPR
jgi:hypothetical protein